MKCANCSLDLKNTITINVRTEAGKLLQFCSTGCYIKGMKKRGVIQ